jgi:hypothetical protein
MDGKYILGVAKVKWQQRQHVKKKNYRSWRVGKKKIFTTASPLLNFECPITISLLYAYFSCNNSHVGDYEGLRVLWCNAVQLPKLQSAGIYLSNNRTLHSITKEYLNIFIYPYGNFNFAEVLFCNTWLGRMMWEDNMACDHGLHYSFDQEKTYSKESLTILKTKINVKYI